jgi:hypothetical protein
MTKRQGRRKNVSSVFFRPKEETRAGVCSAVERSLKMVKI